jgi:hypothetical protein
LLKRVDVGHVNQAYNKILRKKKPFGRRSEGLLQKSGVLLKFDFYEFSSTYGPLCRFGFTRKTATTTIRIGEHNDFNHTAKVGALISFLQVKNLLLPKKIFYFAYSVFNFKFLNEWTK